MKVSEGWLQEFRFWSAYIVVTSKVVKREGVGEKVGAVFQRDHSEYQEVGWEGTFYSTGSEGPILQCVMAPQMSLNL